MAEEKIEKGIISEEALEEIAGGLKAFGYDIPNDKIKKAAIGAGVTVLGVAGSLGIGYIGKKLYDGCKSKNKKIDQFNQTVNGDFINSHQTVEEIRTSY